MVPPAIVPVAATTSAPSGTYLDPKVSDQVQKHCRYTISALQYDDVGTAISNLEQALAILKAIRK
jgi:vacuolar protein sorting-associated protein VTA1